MSIVFEIWESPIGRLHIAADESALCALAFDSNWPRIHTALGIVQEGSNALTQQAISQLQEYFAGVRQTFELTLQLHGTEFQLQVWQALQEITYGETRSYSEQADAIGKLDAVRAIGTTNGLNPISIVVPCHRVIAKSGKLAGYAGGVAAKQYLLQLESREPELRLI